MTDIAGLILAGGQSRRMNGIEKAFVPVGGVAMLTRIVGILSQQCSTVAISANGDAARFAAYGCPVVADETPFRGALAGLTDALDWFARNRPDVTHVLSAPSDTPFLPHDLASRFGDVLSDGAADCACAMSDGRRHFVVGLWPVVLRAQLRAAVTGGGLSFRAALSQTRVAFVEWNAGPRDPFFNVNTPDDLDRANALA